MRLLRLFFRRSHATPYIAIPPKLNKSCKKIAAKLRQSLERYFENQGLTHSELQECTFYWYINLCSLRILDIQDAWPQELQKIACDTRQNPSPGALNLALPALLHRLSQLLPHCFVEPEPSFLRHCPGTWLVATGFALLSQALPEHRAHEIERLAWLFQFYFDADKKRVSASMRSGTKADARTLPMVTQIFTPQWIVQFLLHNALGRFFVTEDLPYFMGTRFARSAPDLEDFSLCDPACGAGLMLLQAAQSLWQICKSQGIPIQDIPACLARILHGQDIDVGACRVAALGLALKIRQLSLQDECPIELSEKYLPKILHIHSIQFKNARQTAQRLWEYTAIDCELLLAILQDFAKADLLGSLIEIPLQSAQIQALCHAEHAFRDSEEEYSAFLVFCEYLTALSQKHSIVITNPPYLGSRNMPAALFVWAKTRAPLAKHDLFSLFMARALSMTAEGGFASLVVMQSWLFLSKFASLRAQLARSTTLSCLALLQTNVMGIAFGTSAAVWQKSLDPQYETPFCSVSTRDLVDGAPSSWPAPTHKHKVCDFDVLEGSPLVFKLQSPMIELLSRGETLQAHCDIKQGLATTDNAQFVKPWYEVGRHNIAFNISDASQALESGATWFPYNKGGEYRKWWGNQCLVVNWKNDGESIKSNIVRKYPYLNGNPSFVAKNQAFYFRPSISFSKVGMGSAAFRAYPKGFIFDVAGTSIFPREQDWRQVLAFLNSILAQHLLQNLAPTLNLEIRQCAKLPWVLAQPKAQIDTLVDGLITCARKDWDSSERSWDFVQHELCDVETYDELLERACENLLKAHEQRTRFAFEAETELNERILHCVNVQNSGLPTLKLSEISLFANPHFVYKMHKDPKDYADLKRREIILSLISYGVSCLFGRYPTEHSLVVHDTLRFKDLARELLGWIARVFGASAFERNAQFLQQCLGKSLEDYLRDDFMQDHIRRYEQRPVFCADFGSLKCIKFGE